MQKDEMTAIDPAIGSPLGASATGDPSKAIVRNVPITPRPEFFIASSPFEEIRKLTAEEKQKLDDEEPLIGAVRRGIPKIHQDPQALFLLKTWSALVKLFPTGGQAPVSSAGSIELARELTLIFLNAEAEEWNRVHGTINPGESLTVPASLRSEDFGFNPAIRPAEIASKIIAAAEWTFDLQVPDQRREQAMDRIGHLQKDAYGKPLLWPVVDERGEFVMQRNGKAPVLAPILQPRRLPTEDTLNAGITFVKSLLRIRSQLPYTTSREEEAVILKAVAALNPPLNSSDFERNKLNREAEIQRTIRGLLAERLVMRKGTAEELQISKLSSEAEQTRLVNIVANARLVAFPDETVLPPASLDRVKRVLAGLRRPKRGEDTKRIEAENQLKIEASGLSKEEQDYLRMNRDHLDESPDALRQNAEDKAFVDEMRREDATYQEYMRKHKQKAATNNHHMLHLPNARYPKD